MRKDSVQRILVRGPNWIGDTVMCIPALMALRDLFPTATITLLARRTIADLLRGHPSIDDLLEYDHQGQHAGILGKIKLARTLRRLHFDFAVLFQNAFEAALLAWLAGIPARYGYATDGRAWLLSTSVPVTTHHPPLHQVQYYQELIRSLGGTQGIQKPTLVVSIDEEQHIAKRLADASILESDMLIGLNPGSTYGSAKRWFPKRFAETADRVLEEITARRLTEGTARCVIVGAPGEEQLGHDIAEAMQAEPLVLSGKTSIRELMAVIKRCSLFITNDTGPMHIANAFGVPLVAMFGPTNPHVTSPFGDKRVVIQHQVRCSPCFFRTCPIDHRCMTQVSVEEVYRSALAQLECDHALQGITVFLDRDGTLVRQDGYLTSPEKLEMLPGAVEAVARLKDAGAQIILVTNQSAVARGFINATTLESIHNKLQELLQMRGGSLDAIYFCPHHPDDGCSCRKPNPGLVRRAADDRHVDMGHAYMVGDQCADIELANREGIKAVLVTTGPQSFEAVRAIERQTLRVDYVAKSFAQAVGWIIGDAVREKGATSCQSETCA